MQRKGKSRVFSRGVSSRLLTCFLLFYLGLILLLFILGAPPPSLLILPFYLLIPGYAFVAAVFPQLRKLEKAVMSVGFSIGLFAGIKSFIQTFAIKTIFSEFAILTFLSVVCLIVKLTK